MDLRLFYFNVTNYRPCLHVSKAHLFCIVIGSKNLSWKVSNDKTVEHFYEGYRLFKKFPRISVFY